MRMGAIGWVAFVLIIVGGLNWGLIGAFNFNLVSYLFGIGTMITQAIYILVGLSAVYMLFRAPR